MYTKDIQNKTIPNHVAIIMDGNGRWAKSKGLPRIEGHRRGAKVARNMIKIAHDRGIKYMTFFAFSSENWSRPAKEVDGLMNMLRHYMKSDVKELEKHNARLHVIGEIERLPHDVFNLIRKWEEKTKNNDGIHIIMALSYGGRQDIVSAVKRLVKSGIPADKIDEETLSNSLMTKNIPDPDLLIRTSGEQRVSNFLLWQLAYTELYFTQTAWPDFNARELDKALSSYANRDRRYGCIEKEQVEAS